MKKRLVAFCIVLLLVMQVPVQVQAAKASRRDITGISAYCLDNQLCAFVKLGKAYNSATMKATAYTEKEAISGEASPVLLKESSSIARYLFMVDLSGSMKEHIGEINSFVRGLMNAEKQTAVFTVATFGERFTVVSENQTDKSAVLNTLSRLEYSEKLTDPYNGMENALNYLDSCSRRSGDIVNLILISDGEPDLGYSTPKKERAAEKRGAKRAAEKIAAAPETLVHTLVLSGKDSSAFKQLEKGSGIDQRVSGTQSGKKAGKKIAAFVDSLYAITFPLQRTITEEELPITLQFQGDLKSGKFAMQSVSWDLVPLLKAFSHTGEDPVEKPSKKPAKPSKKPAKDDEKTSDDDSSGNNKKTPDDDSSGNDKKTPDDDSSGDDKKTPDNNTDSENTFSGNAVEDEESSSLKLSGLGIYLVAGGAGILLIILVILLCVLLTRRKKKTAGSGNGRNENGRVAEPNAGDAVYMKLEIISGQCKTSEKGLYLTDQLIIGSAPDCDLVWGERDVSKHNSRIYRKEQMIYIEDLDSKNGTFLNGMRLHAPSRLRSGDEITIGTAGFLFRF